MTQFVHLADAKTIAAIRRVGIKGSDVRGGQIRGVYCTPVSRSVFKTHQWLRELKRQGVKSIDAVQFYLPSNTPVLVGSYRDELVQVTASEASRIFESHEHGLGLEVVVRHPIPNSAIKRIYTPNQVSGWRYYPEAKGSKPFCGCKYCNRGEMNAYRVITEV